MKSALEEETRECSLIPIGGILGNEKGQLVKEGNVGDVQVVKGDVGDVVAIQKAM